MSESTSYPINVDFTNNSSRTGQWLKSATLEEANSLNQLKTQSKLLASENAEAKTMGMGWFTGAVEAEEDEQGRGSLAKTFKPSGNGGLIDIVKQFPWTVSPTYQAERNDIPYIQLKEHKVEGGSIQQQYEFYTNGIGEATEDFFEAGGDRGILKAYEKIFIENATGWTYKFPYFEKLQYELNTTPWEQFDKLGDQVSSIGSGLGAAFGKTKAGDIVRGATDLFKLTTNAANIAQQFKYPVTGIVDRPRMFTSHAERSIKVEFPLYNTIGPWDWQKNREFLYLFQSQNLFNKRNFSTGLPPVWYRVLIPGQYFSIASCVTNFTVENLGNIRMENRGSNEFIVPDAYQVSITLQEMASPSKNQFQAAVGVEGRNYVTTGTVMSTGQQSSTVNRVSDKNQLNNASLTPSDINPNPNDRVTGSSM